MWWGRRARARRCAVRTSAWERSRPQVVVVDPNLIFSLSSLAPSSALDPTLLASSTPPSQDTQHQTPPQNA